MRVPTGDEMRYLIYTTLAYGAQGVSYYVYCHPGHTGGIALADGTPTPLYEALKSLVANSSPSPPNSRHCARLARLP